MRVALSTSAFVEDLGPAPRSRRISHPSVALNNLRAVVILVVLAFHSALAYLQFGPHGVSSFDSAPYAWRAFPIVDSRRFLGFDLFCAWQDVHLMSFMFFLSGLFVWTSLTRKGGWGFLRERLMRLGIPYIFGLIVLMPIATYPTYLLTAADPSLAAYWQALLALPFLVNGPLWFLWQLVALSAVAAIVFQVAPGAMKISGCGPAWRKSGSRRISLCCLRRPHWRMFRWRCCSRRGPGPILEIFAVQLCRPIHYAVYFFAGIAIGVAGLDRGLMAANGPLAGRCMLWLFAALASLALWMGLTSLTFNADASLPVAVASDLSFVLACAASCFFLIAASLRFGGKPSRILGKLASNAYALYLLHYIFIVWLQFALLDWPLPAFFKAVFVFTGTLIGSALLAAVVQRVPFGAHLIGSARRPLPAWAAEAEPESAPRSRVGEARSAPQ